MSAEVAIPSPRRPVEKLSAGSYLERPSATEVEPSLHALQLAAVDAKFASSFFRASKKNAQSILPSLIHDERDPRVKDKDLRTRHVFGLIDAYRATRPGTMEEMRTRMNEFEGNWGEKGDFLISQLNTFLPALEEERTEMIANPETIEPYDVKMIQKTARKLRSRLPKNQQELFTQLSGVTPESRNAMLAKKGASIAIGVASLFAADAAAGAVAGPVESSHLHLLESMDWRLLTALWAASYTGFATSVWKSARANSRLSRETDMSTNLGFQAGEALAQARGNDVGDEITQVASQAGFEFVKDSLWNIAIGTAVLANAMNLRDAAITSGAANLGGMAYEFGIVNAVNQGLNVRRKIYNRRHANDFRVQGAATDVSSPEVTGPESTGTLIPVNLKTHTST